VLAVLLSPLELPIASLVSTPEDFFVTPTFSAKDTYEDSSLASEDGEESTVTFTKGAPLPAAYGGQSADEGSAVTPTTNPLALTPISPLLVAEEEVSLVTAIQPRRTARSDRHVENAMAAIAVASGDTSSELTEVTLDAEGNIVATTDVHGATKSAEYDEAGRPVRITNSDGSESYYAYNAGGQVTSISRTEAVAEQGPLAMLFSKISSPLWALADDEDTISYDYQNGDITDVRDGAGAVRYEYDEEGLVTAEYRADGSGIEYSYDELGNVVSSEEFESDLDRLSLGSFFRFSYASPLSAYLAEESSYNDNNKLAEYKIAWVEETLDAEVLSATTSEAATPVSTTTTEVAAPVATTSEVTAEVVAEPAADEPVAIPLLPEVIEEVIVETAQVVAGLFNRTTSTLALWFDVSLSRAFAQVQALTETPVEPVASSTPLYSISYSYDAQGNVTESRSSVGVVTSYRYDAHTDALLEKTVTSPSGVTSTINYELNADARIVASDGVGYEFSSSGMLTRAGANTYTYDEFGNRIQATGASYTYSGNRLLDVSYEDGRVVTYAYDDRGAVSSVSDTQKGLTEFTYAIDGAVESIERAGVKTSYTYDALGRRIARYSNVDGTWSYEYNGQLLKRVKAADGAMLREYFYTPTNELTAIRSGETLYQVVVSNNKSVTGLVEVKTGAMYTQRYDAWGTVVASDFPVALDIGYIGAFAETSLGLAVFGPRVYDPELGRFLSKDPLPGVLIDNLSQNEYIYAKNDPIHQYDPSGHASELAEKSDSPKRAMVETKAALDALYDELRVARSVHLALQDTPLPTIVDVAAYEESLATAAATVSALEVSIASLQEVLNQQEQTAIENENEALATLEEESQVVSEGVSPSAVVVALDTTNLSATSTQDVELIPVFDVVVPEINELPALSATVEVEASSTTVSALFVGGMVAMATMFLDEHIQKAEAKKKSKSKKKDKKKVSKKAKVKQDKKAKQLAKMRKQLDSLHRQLSVMKVKVDARVKSESEQRASNALLNIETTNVAQIARLNYAPVKPITTNTGSICGTLISCSPLSAGITSPSASYGATQTKSLSQYFTATNAHYALTACGFEQTVIGAGCGLLDGVLYAFEGDWTGAGLSSLSAVPFIGATGDYAKSARLALIALRTEIATKIASGHALTKHLNEFQDLGIVTGEQFVKHAESVISNPTHSKKLERGREAYFDQKSNTVLIHDPYNVDLGTIFRQNIDYYNNLK
jgi:RHS repeat-associated protein